jgi:hypothetical protein
MTPTPEQEREAKRIVYSYLRYCDERDEVDRDEMAGEVAAFGAAEFERGKAAAGRLLCLGVCDPNCPCRAREPAIRIIGPTTTERIEAVIRALRSSAELERGEAAGRENERLTMIDEFGAWINDPATSFTPDDKLYILTNFMQAMKRTALRAGGPD